MIEKNNKLFGLLGKNIGYSFSRTYFSEKFEKENSDHKYVNFDLESLTEFPKLLQRKNLAGINVTIPYKQDVIPFLDKLDPTAEKIGAVNTIVFKGTQRIGYNTDCIGFQNTLEKYLKPHHNKALVLGTGGASKAVCYVLDRLNIEYVMISRQAGVGKKSYKQLTDNDYAEHSLIINCTPLGTYPKVNESPTINYERIGKNHLFYDLIYNPEITEFMRLGKQKGATTVNGLQMLVGQAEASWLLWNQEK